MIVDVIKRLQAKKEVIIATDFDDTLVKALLRNYRIDTVI